MQGRRAPKLVWLTRDFYNAFFGWRTAVTFMYGMVEQGAKVVIPTFMLLYLARRSFNKFLMDKQASFLNEKRFKSQNIKLYKSDFN